MGAFLESIRPLRVAEPFSPQVARDPATPYRACPYCPVHLCCVTRLCYNISLLQLYQTTFYLDLQVEFMQEMSTQQRLCVASIAGTIMIARSPATAIAVLKEVDGRGPFCSLTLNVVVMKDVVVIILFALNFEGIKFLEK
eukprot:4612794-Pyramimonas_sp.AAC.1